MTDGPNELTPSMFAIFRNRDFTFLWSAQLVSTIGSALTSLAASIVVYRATGSALSVGLMLMATAAPSLLIGLLAGVFVDRWDRKRILIVADLLRALLVFLIPTLISIDVAWLYAMVLLTSVVSQFFDPAHASLLPEIASDEELASANSFLAISAFGSTAVGFAASGLIASRFPIAWAFYLDGLTFLASAALVYFVSFEHQVASLENKVSSVLDNLREGAGFLLGNQVLRSLLIVSVPALLGAGLWNTLLLPFAERALGATEFEYGLQEGLTSIGFVVGSLLMARWADRLREGQWIVIGFLGVGLVAMGYSSLTSIPLAILLVTIAGFSNAPSAIARRLLIQRNVPGEIQGRVYSAFFVTRDVLFLIGMAAAGLADTIAIRPMVFASATLIALSGVLGLFLSGLGRPTESWLRSRRVLEAASGDVRLGPAQSASMGDFDALAGYIPAFRTLTLAKRQEFIGGSKVRQADEGALLVRAGDPSESVYFVLAGRAAAAVRTDEQKVRALSSMGPGDFFGEIAALTDSPRTADVVAETDVRVLEVPAERVQDLMANARVRYLLLSKATERLARTHMVDWPRISTLDFDVQDRLRMLLEGAQVGAES